MKTIYLGIALLTAVQTGLAQDAPPPAAPPTSQKPPEQVEARQRSASEDQSPGQRARQEEQRAREAVDQANAALRRAAQRQQLATPPDGPSASGYTRGLAAGKTQKGAWLGLSASPPPAALRRQLKLPDGTGLVIDFVQPKSPAEEAGLKQYDLLVKLNDQLLINAEQLAVLVRTFKPDEQVRVTFFREGERQTQPVKLVERDLPPLSDVRYLYDNQIQFLNNADPKLQPMPPVRIAPAPRGGGGGGAGGATSGKMPPAPMFQRSERTLTWLDGKRQITVNFGDDGKMLTVTDAQSGKVLYEGPADLSGQLKAPSREVRDVLERLRGFLKSQSADSDDAAGKIDPAR